jgi:hypothetical protein
LGALRGNNNLSESTWFLAGGFLGTTGGGGESWRENSSLPSGTAGGAAAAAATAESGDTSWPLGNRPQVFGGEVVLEEGLVDFFEEEEEPDDTVTFDFGW